MAEFLVFIRNAGVAEPSGHWMDASGQIEKLNARIDSDSKLSADQKIRSKEKLSRKFSAREQVGDIVEVRPDGFFGEPGEKKHGWNHHCFALVRCPGMSLAAAKKYEQGMLDSSDPPKVLKKRRYHVQTLGLSAGEVRTVGSVNPANKGA